MSPKHFSMANMRLKSLTRIIGTSKLYCWLQGPDCGYFYCFLSTIYNSNTQVHAAQHPSHGVHPSAFYMLRWAFLYHLDAAGHFLRDAQYLRGSGHSHKYQPWLHIFDTALYWKIFSRCLRLGRYTGREWVFLVSSEIPRSKLTVYISVLFFILYKNSHGIRALRACFGFRV